MTFAAARPLLLSEKALSRISDLRRNASNGDQDLIALQAINTFRHHPPFDDAYLSLYALARLGPRHENRPSIASIGGVDIDVLLDMDLPLSDSSEVPLDEWAVADVVSCSDILQRISPFELELAHVELGCVLLRFHCKPQSFKPLEGTALSPQEAKSILTRYFTQSNPEFAAAAARYRIRDVDISCMAPHDTIPSSGTPIAR